ncbi:type II toxin-antitoxin system RelE/ParE family toxin [Limnofasciculus baicalensis]|uniref:Type II toxin-antitoxin system RelE/ParE family toxin n=1 Tax=Limnofasciculus baicalensis BBK-W-15 TaxID=2699891 RepID=A0AAE3KKY4_9CYAN|nr:type II toxin-antitoxin system RelE/ParE family toxin [Limnofasciculus baicalensis]MCP2727066.1 type II toxin-antitoxin system RelE/ParE family toxin [Limnofasciculus baicalensis BBK-W-15]
MTSIEIKLLETDEGKVPFEEWYNSLKDKVTKVKIRRRLDRIELGNFGDTESLGEGVYELRIHFGAGYRIYFTRVGNVIVVLLGGGDKSTQKRDIAKAKEMWQRYKNEAERYVRKLGL